MKPRWLIEIRKKHMAMARQMAPLFVNLLFNNQVGFRENTIRNIRRNIELIKLGKSALNRIMQAEISSLSEFDDERILQYATKHTEAEISISIKNFLELLMCYLGTEITNINHWEYLDKITLFEYINRNDLIDFIKRYIMNHDKKELEVMLNLVLDGHYDFDPIGKFTHESGHVVVVLNHQSLKLWLKEASKSMSKGVAYKMKKNDFKQSRRQQN